MDFLIQDKFENRITSITPIKNRGCQLSLVIKDESLNGKEIFNSLTEKNVIGDWREPNVIRIIITVLGNHDLHLLSLYYQAKEIDDNSSELKDILNAPDSEILIDWLRKRPLVFYDRKKNYILVHAGIHPRWTINESIKYASEVEAILRSDHCSSIPIMETLEEI